MNKKLNIIRTNFMKYFSLAFDWAMKAIYYGAIPFTFIYSKLYYLKF